MMLKTGANRFGKPDNLQRRHPVRGGIQRRLRRASLIQKDTLKLISQNINGLSLSNHHKREEIFYKFNNKAYDVALLQECYTYHHSTILEDFIIHDNARFISHSQHARRGGLGFILSRDAQKAWSNAGEYIRHRTIDGTTRISTIRLSYKAGHHTRCYHIINAYFPTSDADNSIHEEMHNQLAESIDECPPSAILIIGGDINAWIGTSSDWDGDNNTMGRFGIRGINEKGENLMQLLLNSDLKAVSTFFEKKKYATYRTKKGETAGEEFDHTYDHFFLRSNNFKIVRDFNIADLADSDHCGISMVVYNKPKPSSSSQFRKLLRHSSKASIKRHTNGHSRRIIWQKLYNEHHRKQYNTSLTALLAECDNINHSTLSSAISSAATEALSNSTQKRPDWFQLSKEKLLDVIRTRDIAMREFNHSCSIPSRSAALEKLRWARKQVKIAVAVAKEHWI